MTKFGTLNRRGLFRRSGAIAAGGLGALAVPHVAGATTDPPTSEATGSQSTNNADDVNALMRLKVDYAMGTDAIAAGDTERGLALYTALFTPDASITAGFDPAAPALSATGPEEYAATVIEAMATSLASQHLLGTSKIDVTGDTATLLVYFQATVLGRDDTSFTTYLGQYEDEAVRTDGTWKISTTFARYLAVHSGTRDAP